MSFISDLFSRKPDFPDLDPTSTAATRVAEVEAELDTLAHQVNDRLEVVPSEHAAYVYIGKPPKKFGLAWIHDGKISGLNTLVEEHGLGPLEVSRVMTELGEAYERNADVKRYCAHVHDKDVVVTPSDKLEREVHEIIDKVVQH